MIHQRHRQTDRQADNMQSQDHTLHYSASHGCNSSVTVIFEPAVNEQEERRHCHHSNRSLQYDQRVLGETCEIGNQSNFIPVVCLKESIAD